MNLPRTALFIFFAFPFFIKSQPGLIVKADGDTIVCYNLDWNTTMNGSIVDLAYETADGKKVLLKKKKQVPRISCIHDGWKIYEVMPLKLKKPKSYYRLGERVVDGKLQVSMFNSLHESQTFDPYDKNYQAMNGTSWKTTTSGTYLFHIRMPDGKKYKINRHNMKKVIKPYLLQCPAFVSAYTGDYSWKEAGFVEMAKLYNSLCN